MSVFPFAALLRWWSLLVAGAVLSLGAEPGRSAHSTGGFTGPYAPAVEGARQGIASYYSRQLPTGQPEVRLLDSNREEIGRLVIVSNEPEGFECVFSDQRTHLRLIWNRARPAFSFSTDGQSPLTWEGDKKHARWVAVGVDALSAQGVLEKYARELKLAMAAMVDWNRRGIEPHFINSCWDFWYCDPWGGGGGGGVQICCTGPWVRGEYVADSRSWCCENARIDAGNECNNSCCWGCCKYLPCDAYCLLGDYGCFCGVSGQMCENCNGGYCF